MEGRKPDAINWTLVLYGVGVALYGLWAGFAVLFSLMAESGGKNPSPWLAVVLVWSLCELAWTWLGISRRRDSYWTISREKRQLGGGLIALAVVLPTPLTICLSGIRPWQLSLLLPAAITIAASRVGRHLLVPNPATST